MEHNVLPLFSSPVFTTTIDVSDRPTWDTVSWDNIESRSVTVTDDILDKPEWLPIRTRIEECLRHFYHEVLLASKSIDINITISWANKENPEQLHERHNHPNSVLSGVLYFDDHPNGIKFVSNLFPQIHWEKSGWNLLNSQTWRIEPKTGLLLIFPSYLEHEVEVLAKDAPVRYSLSFNTWLSGTVWSGRQMSLRL
jgi:uncharacterized protein (TIGR02466 family)